MGRKGNSEYNLLGCARISDNTDVTISEFSGGGYTMSQRIAAKNGSREVYVYLKGAFHIDDITGLYNLRDTINAAIDEYEKKEK